MRKLRDLLPDGRLAVSTFAACVRSITDSDSPGAEDRGEPASIIA